MSMNFTQLSSDWLPLADALVKATLLLACAGAVAFLLRRSSAALRHMVWTSALTAALMLPLGSQWLPAWHLPLLTAPSAERAIAQPPLRVAADAPAAAIDAPPLKQRVASNRAAAPAPQIVPTWRDELSSIRLATWFAAVWALGAFILIARLVVGVLAVRRMARRTEPADNASWFPVARALARDLGIATIDFRRSSRSTMPMTWGVLRPVVLMPAEADEWPFDRLRIVLLHELAHVKRADCLTHLLAQAACAVYWMNPLAWIAARRSRTERERACDDLVLACGTPGPAYATELLEIARVMRAGKLSVAIAGASLAMAHRSQLEGRLMAILDPSVPRSGVTRVRKAFVAGLSVAMLMPLASLQPWAAAEAASPRGAALETMALPTPEPLPQAQVQTLPVVSAPVIDAAIASALASIPKETVQASTHAAVDGVMQALPEIVDAAVDGALAGIGLQETKGGGRDPKVVNALLEALKDSDKEVRESAMHALVRMRDPRMFDPLVAALKDASADVREQAAFGLGQLRDRRAIEPLKQALKDEIANVREQVVFALGQLRDPATVDALSTALRDASADVREQVAFALGQLRDERALNPLVAALKDSSGSVREQAAFALGQLRTKAAVDALIAAMKDEDVDVREQAAFALGQIGDPRAVDALTAALKDASAQVRQQAAFALGQLAR